MIDPFEHALRIFSDRDRYYEEQGIGFVCVYTSDFGEVEGRGKSKRLALHDAKRAAEKLEAEYMSKRGAVV